MDLIFRGLKTFNEVEYMDINKITANISVDGIEGLNETINDINQYATLLKLGYFPVTDDFWLGAGITFAIGEGFDWAYHTPMGEQKFMPWHGELLMKMSFEELKEHALKQITRSY